MSRYSIDACRGRCGRPSRYICVWHIQKEVSRSLSLTLKFNLWHYTFELILVLHCSIQYQPLAWRHRTLCLCHWSQVVNFTSLLLSFLPFSLSSSTLGVDLSNCSQLLTGSLSPISGPLFVQHQHSSLVLIRSLTFSIMSILICCPFHALFPITCCVPLLRWRHYPWVVCAHVLPTKLRVMISLVPKWYITHC